MWHEARRQERKIRRVIVDYRKRSERRHLYYERIKQDPTKFLQVHGRKSKIHLDGTVAAEADNNNHMMPWQADSSNMIDRFDVRTHLDFYRETPKSDDDDAMTEEERKCNFERYRVLIWNEYKNITESQHLRQIYIDEQFPEISAQQKQRQDAEVQKQMLAQTRASIGYDYEHGGMVKSTSKLQSNVKGGDNFMGRGKAGDDEGSGEDDDIDFLQELEEIPPLSEINMEAITAMDEIGVKKYKLRRGGFGDSLLDDQDYLDRVGEAKALESEKQKFSGRKSRRERRLLKDERLRGREIGELSFVRRDSSHSGEASDSDSSSSSSGSSSSDAGSSDSERAGSKQGRGNKIEYITSFGDDAEGISSNKQGSFLGKSGRRASSSDESYSVVAKSKRSKSRSSSPERYRTKRRRSRSGSYQKSRHKYSNSGSYRKERQRRSRSPSYERRGRRSRSRSRSRRSHSRDRRSRSYSRERRSKSRDSKYKSATAVINSTSASYKSKLPGGGPKSAEAKAAAIKKLTPQEKLKIKMQRALNKQLKVDRNADMEKRMVKQQELMDREDDIREMSRKMRKRERAEEEKNMRAYPDMPYC